MSKSTTSSVFPDINVWLALSSPDHIHFQSAWNWYSALATSVVLLFCRHTQMGLLRLLTTQAAMGPGTLSQADAWQAYDRWIDSGGAQFVTEPSGAEALFRSKTTSPQASPKDWADAYLAAFSLTTGSQLVTFDHALAGKVKAAILLH